MLEKPEIMPKSWVEELGEAQEEFKRAMMEHFPPLILVGRIVEWLARKLGESEP